MEKTDLKSRYEDLCYQITAAKMKQPIEQADLEWVDEAVSLAQVDKYKTQECLRACLDGYQHFPLVYQALTNRGTLYTCPTVVIELLDYLRRHIEPDKFTAALAGAAKVCIKQVLKPYKPQEHIQTLAQMCQEFELARRNDMYSSRKNFANLITDVIADGAVFDMDANISLEEEQVKRENLAKLYALHLDNGGGLENIRTMSFMGGQGSYRGTLHELWHMYDKGKLYPYPIQAMLDAGAEWKHEYDEMPEHIQQILDTHPRVRAEKLAQVAVRRERQPSKKPAI